MLRVEIKDGNVIEKSGTIRRGDRAGETFSSRQQEGWADLGRAYPQRFLFSLGKDRPAYPPGDYMVAAGSYEVGEYDRLQFGYDLVLVRHDAKAKPSVM